jgi:hypothetical protein
VKRIPRLFVGQAIGSCHNKADGKGALKGSREADPKDALFYGRGKRIAAPPSVLLYLAVRIKKEENGALPFVGQADI